MTTRRRARTANALDELDQRYHPAAGLRKQFNKVFPMHWSFLLGETVLYSFVVLLLSGSTSRCSSTRRWPRWFTTCRTTRCAGCG